MKHSIVYRFIIWLFFSLMFVSARAQTIRLIDNRNAQAVEHATVYYQTPSGLRGHVASDNEGKVFIKNKSYPVIITIQHPNYFILTDTLTSDKGTIEIKLKFHHLQTEDVVVTAQYAPGLATKAVQQIRIIDAAKIKAMGAQNLRDVLSNELNIRLSQDNILGSSLSLQGVSGQNVKILVDGVPVIGRLNGSIDISQLNMNNVERIEVIEGPLSVNYGTDALAGTINIITKKQTAKKPELSLNTYYESVGNYNANIRAGITRNANSLLLTAGRNYFDGWRNADALFTYEGDRVANANRFMNWKPKEQYFGSVTFGRKFKTFQTYYTLDGFKEQITNKGLPRLPYYESAFDDYYYTTRINNAVNINGKVNAKNSLQVIMAYNYYQRIKNTYYTDLTTLNKELTQNAGDQDTSVFKTFNTRANWIHQNDSHKVNYELGMDINHETATGARMKSTAQYMGDYAAFVTMQYKPNSKWIIKPGVRYSYNTIYKAPIIPSVQAKYQANSKYTVRFSYAKGFRAPTLKEMYFLFVDVNHNVQGNPDLKAEQSHNFRASIHRTDNSISTCVKTEGTLFLNHLTQMISLAQSSGTMYSYFNIDKFSTAGAQLSTELAWEKFKIKVAASYIGRSNQLETKNEWQLYWSPEAQTNVVYANYKKNYSFALFYKYTGALPVFVTDASNQIVQSKLQAYHMADFTATKSTKNRKITVGAGVKNLFDVTNILGSSSSGAHSSGSNSVAIGVGRTVFVKLDYNIF